MRQYVKIPTKTPSEPCLFYLLKTKEMITGLLIILILSQVISIALIIQIGKNQETNFQISAKVQVDQWEDIVQIERRVRAIDKKIDLNEHLKKD